MTLMHVFVALMVVAVGAAAYYYFIFKKGA